MHAQPDITQDQGRQDAPHAYRGHSLARQALQHALHAMTPRIQTKSARCVAKIVRQDINISIQQFVSHASPENSKHQKNKTNVMNVPQENILPMKEEEHLVQIAHGDGIKDLKEGQYAKHVRAVELVAHLLQDQHVDPGNIRKLDDGGHASRAGQKNKRYPIKKDVNGAQPENLL